MPADRRLPPAATPAPFTGVTANATGVAEPRSRNPERLCDRTGPKGLAVTAQGLPALVPDWPAPPGVAAFMSTRAGGVSAPPFDSLNLRPPSRQPQAQDDTAAALENQRRWAQHIGAEPVWMDQVHGVQVLTLQGPASPPLPSAHTPASAALWTPRPVADAAVTATFGVACTVLVADCLPVLLCTRSGRAVGAAHAGWRGLCGGVLEATLQALLALDGGEVSEVLAWLGPCIGPEAFEVGPDVLLGFGCSTEPRDHAHFRFRPRRDGEPKWLADLPGLARQRLQSAGVPACAIHGGRWCTVSEPSRFFSYRRDAITGRLAASIALRPPGSDGRADTGLAAGAACA